MSEPEIIDDDGPAPALSTKPLPFSGMTMEEIARLAGGGLDSLDADGLRARLVAMELPAEEIALLVATTEGDPEALAQLRRDAEADPGFAERAEALRARMEEGARRVAAESGRSTAG